MSSMQDLGTHGCSVVSITCCSRRCSSQHQRQGHDHESGVHLRGTNQLLHVKGWHCEGPSSRRDPGTGVICRGDKRTAAMPAALCTVSSTSSCASRRVCRDNTHRQAHRRRETRRAHRTDASCTYIQQQYVAMRWTAVKRPYLAREA